jgi:hypothetical protein
MVSIAKEFDTIIVPEEIIAESALTYATKASTT